MAENRTYCVYKHTTPSEKVYIGITKQEVQKRWKNGKGYELCKAFYRAIVKYGWENIKHEIIVDGLSEEEACSVEIEMIARFKSADPRFGYNLTHGGEHYTPTDEWRKKASESQRKYYAEHPEKREKISKAQTGRKAKESTRLKMSSSRKKYLEEHPGAAYNCGNSFRGKKRSKENCEKLRLANRKPVQCLETGIIFKSVEDAAKSLGVCRTSVSNVLNGRSETAGGFRFKYANEVTNNGET